MTEAIAPDYNATAKMADPKSIYEQLTNKLPDEAIERAPKEKTRKGYDTTGFQYQYIVDRLNEVLGIDGWTFTYVIVKEDKGEWGNGKSYWDITVDCTITIETDGLKAVRQCPGGHKADSHSDALKGAVTNSFKKTAALFGVGAEAYRGSIDDDYLPPDANGSTTAQPGSAGKPVQPAQQGSNGSQSTNGKTKAAYTKCPDCGGQIWDNRAKKASGQFSPKSPNFSCKDKDGCGWGDWGRKKTDEPQPGEPGFDDLGDMPPFDDSFVMDDVPF